MKINLKSTLEWSILLICSILANKIHGTYVPFSEIAITYGLLVLIQIRNNIKK